MGVVAAIKDRLETLAHWDSMSHREDALRLEFSPVFEPIPHVKDLPSNVFAEIRVSDASGLSSTRTYGCPRKYIQSWKTLLDQHLESGKIRPSNSQFASPAFIIPKADPTVLPHWVNDYRRLNDVTINDPYPMPRIDDILADCAKGKIFGVMDMTNSFFQTRVHPDCIHLTAVSTPFGVYEWLVMPMGLKNAPAIHQQRVCAALRKYIGVICHVYLDDIIIWSLNIEEHEENVCTILQALKDAKLFVNPKKTKLFCVEVEFLGHKVSAAGIQAGESKAQAVLDWPRPTSGHEVQQFLGLV